MKGLQPAACSLAVKGAESCSHHNQLVHRYPPSSKSMHGAHGFPGTAHLPYAWELAELFREGQGGDGRADACEELVAELRMVLLGDS